jgi:hypothetical protein
MLDWTVDKTSVKVANGTSVRSTLLQRGEIVACAYQENIRMVSMIDRLAERLRRPRADAEFLIDLASFILDVRMDHWDHRLLTGDPRSHGYLLTVPRVATVWSEPMGPWQFAILEDMSIITPFDHQDDWIEKLSKKAEAVADVWEPEYNLDSVKWRQTQKLLAQVILERLNGARVLVHPVTKKKATKA